MSSGCRAMIGTKRSICTLASTRSSPSRDSPATSARTAPIGTPMPRPHSTRWSDAHSASAERAVADQVASRRSGPSTGRRGRRGRASRPARRAPTGRRAATTPTRRSSPRGTRGRRAGDRRACGPAVRPAGERRRRRGRGRRRAGRQHRSTVGRARSSTRASVIAPCTSCDEVVEPGVELGWATSISAGIWPASTNRSASSCCCSSTSPGRSMNDVDAVLPRRSRRPARG